jgi:hypothetical protein
MRPSRLWRQLAQITHTNMPTAVPVAKEIILGRPKPLKALDPKSRKMMYRYVY